MEEKQPVIKEEQKNSRLVFFDVECASTSRDKDGNEIGNICSYGYVLASMNLSRAEEKKDVIVNPEAGFYLKDSWGQQGVDLAYSEDIFKYYPPFPQRYPMLKNLLEMKDSIVVGFAITNDVCFVLSSCFRYNLPDIHFMYFDTQVAYMKIMNTPRRPSLELALENLGIKTDDKVTAHKSADDAYMTMLLLKGLCEKAGKSAYELMKDVCPEAFSESGYYWEHKNDDLDSNGN
jgi:hypothetical protein